MSEENRHLRLWNYRLLPVYRQAPDSPARLDTRGIQGQADEPPSSKLGLSILPLKVSAATVSNWRRLSVDFIQNLCR